MSDTSAIEWTDATWNPVTGCAKVSQGCKNCYALREWPRLSAPRPQPNVYTGRAFTDVMCHPERLEQPLRWTKPRRIFVNSMSDLFHEAVPDDFILEVFDVMRQCENGFAIKSETFVPAHTFQILTKRPERMLDFCSRLRFRPKMYLADKAADDGFNPMRAMKSVWLGVSVEDQATADQRIPLLLRTPAAVRWISAEPLLGPIDLRAHLAGHCPVHDFYAGFCVQRHHEGVQHLRWVVAGGESGPQARPSHPDWHRTLRDQCQAAGVPFFFKQWGEWAPGDAIMIREPGQFWKVGDYPVQKFYPPHAEVAMHRVGKKWAGRRLDGRTWDEYPAATLKPGMVATP